MTDITENGSEILPVSIWPTTWKYSFIIAVCLFAYLVLLYTSGLAGNVGAGLLSLVITIVLLTLAMRSYRRINNGRMNFGTGVLMGIMISIIASVLRSALNAVYIAYIDKSALTMMTDKTLQKLHDAPGLSQQQIDMIMKIYENYVFTPVGIFVIGCISGIIGGIIISLILAAILKKTPPVAA